MLLLALQVLQLVPRSRKDALFVPREPDMNESLDRKRRRVGDTQSPPVRLRLQDRVVPKDFVSRGGEGAYRCSRGGR